uniref:Uncharacterized protein n=2 Tax=Candidatus Kentrum sp. UNK TaxID=2126344 RepID=A0A451AXM1_9GAMM|nr:MAG: hypothetical protein BECKUNK1418H_GA0071006_103735 [Candidatus Kentron sp. UNK]
MYVMGINSVFHESAACLLKVRIPMKMGTHSEGKWAPIPREMGGAGIADSAGREFLPQ